MLGEALLPTLPRSFVGEPLATAAGDYTVAMPVGVRRPGCAATGLHIPFPAAAGVQGVLGTTAGLLSTVGVTAGVSEAAGNLGAAASDSQ